MTESIQQKLTKVRPPRVQITYDLEVNGAEEKKEIPFVIGVLGNFSGHQKKSAQKIKDMKMLEVDQENFDKVMATIQPKLLINVDDKFLNDSSNLKCELEFKSINDFSPDNLVNNIPKLKELMNIRQRLFEIQAKIDGNELFEEAVRALLKEPEAIQKIAELNAPKTQIN